MSPPTSRHSPARPAGLAPRNSSSAKFICMGFLKNDPHATKTKNHFVYIFLALYSDEPIAIASAVQLDWWSSQHCAAPVARDIGV